MKRLLVVMSAIFALMLATSVPASAAGRDALGIIKAKTGADAVRVTAAQSVGGLMVGTGRDRTGKALASYAQRISATSVRMLATISDSSQSSVDYSLGLPAGAGLVPQSDGSMVVIRELTGPNTGVEVFGTIATPWAVDAIGKALSTSYTYRNGVLTQSIDTAGAVLPVVADPSIQFGWYYVPVVYETLSRTETFRAWNYFWSGPVLTALMCFYTGPAQGACDLVVALYWHSLYVQLDYAVHNYHRCLKARIPYPATWWPIAGAFYTVYC